MYSSALMSPLVNSDTFVEASEFDSLSSSASNHSTVSSMLAIRSWMSAVVSGTPVTSSLTWKPDRMPASPSACAP